MGYVALMIDLNHFNSFEDWVTKDEMYWCLLCVKAYSQYDSEFSPLIDIL